MLSSVKKANAKEIAEEQRCNSVFNPTRCVGCANMEETDMAVDQSKIQKIVDLAKTYGATRLILFGSMAKTPLTARDIDIACDGVPGWKLYEMAARIEDELGNPGTPYQFSRMPQSI